VELRFQVDIDKYGELMGRIELYLQRRSIEPAATRKSICDVLAADETENVFDP
jgi:hypothetical protein